MRLIFKADAVAPLNDPWPSGSRAPAAQRRRRIANELEGRPVTAASATQPGAVQAMLDAAAASGRAYAVAVSPSAVRVTLHAPAAMRMLAIRDVAAMLLAAAAEQALQAAHPAPVEAVLRELAAMPLEGADGLRDYGIRNDVREALRPHIVSALRALFVSELRAHDNNVALFDALLP